MKIKRLESSKFLFMLVILLVFVVYFLRIINIEQDLPAWGVAYYQPKDEGAYVNLAINEYEYGEPVPHYEYNEAITRRMYIPEQLRFNIIENAIVTWGLNTFGDNYYGTRVPIVILCSISLMLELITLLLLNKRYVPNENRDKFKWIALVLLFLNAFHFYFFIASRTVEPSTMRMVAVELIFLIWLSDSLNPSVKFFLMGLLATCSVFFVYLTNIFVFVAIGLLLLFILIKKKFKIFLKYTIYFIAGCVVAYISAYFACKAIYGESPFDIIKEIFATFSNLEGYTIAADRGGIVGWLINIIKGIVKYFSAYIFLYMPALLVGVFLFTIPCIKTAWKKNDEVLVLLITLPASLLLQTMFSEDYIWRKAIVILPFVFYLIFWGTTVYKELHVQLQTRFKESCSAKSRQKTKRIIDLGAKFSPKVKYYFWVFVIFCAITTFTVYHLELSHDEALWDFGMPNKIIIAVFGLLPVILWAATLIRHYQKTEFYFDKLFIVMVCTSLIGSAVLLTTQVWLYPTYKEKEMMQSLSTKYNLDGKYIIGDYVIGCTLYNDIKPVTDNYKNYEAQLVSNPNLLFLHYSQYKKGMRSYLDNKIFSKWDDYSARQIVTIKGTFKAFGEKVDWALYKADKKSIIVNENRMYYAQITNTRKLYNDFISSSAGMDLNQSLIERERLESSNNSVKLLYPDIYGNLTDTIELPIYVDIHGDIYGDIYAPIYGNIYGDIYGNVGAKIYGNIYGNVYGEYRSFISENQIKGCGTSNEKN
jgi:hypothetical protein